MDTITEFGTFAGAVLDAPDKRDFKYSEIIAGAAPFDWTKPYDIEVVLGLTLPVKDQGQSLSCGGQAWSSYGNALEAFFNKTIDDHSAKFIYAQTAVQGGGSGGRDNSDVVVKQGWAEESVLPSYDNGNPPSEAFMTDKSGITDAVRLNAAKDKALSYATVDTDIDSIAQAIQNNQGVVIGVTGSNNGTWRSSYPLPPKAGETLWLHWVYAGKVKVINGVKHIGILNSWGKNTGDNGWQWLSEEYVNAVIGNYKGVFSVWTLVFNPNKPSPDFIHNFATDINYGDVSDEVKALQTALQISGQYPKGVPITGRYLDITRQAVLDFQQRYVSPDGIWQKFVVWFNQGRHVSSLTRQKLNNIFG